MPGSPFGRSARLAEESQPRIAASLVERALAVETARGTGYPKSWRRHCAELARIETNHPMIRFLQKRCAQSPAQASPTGVGEGPVIEPPAAPPSAEPAAVSSGTAASSVPQAARSHRFMKGDSLWNLAVKYYGNGSSWKKILEANQERIKDPASIEIGSELLIP